MFVAILRFVTLLYVKVNQTKLRFVALVSSMMRNNVLFINRHTINNIFTTYLARTKSNLLKKIINRHVSQKGGLSAFTVMGTAHLSTVFQSPPKQHGTDVTIKNSICLLSYPQSSEVNFHQKWGILIFVNFFLLFFKVCKLEVY